MHSKLHLPAWRRLQCGALWVCIVAATGCGTKLEPINGAAAGCHVAGTVTYANGAEKFFSTYCLRCHSSTAPDRHGAPPDYNYDTYNGAQAHASEIRAQVAQMLMPIDAPTSVTAADRCLIEAWVDQGALP